DKGDAGQLADLGWRLTGSADLYGDDGRSAYNSANFVTCHDGFTLADLVSYNGEAQRGQRRGQQRRLQRQQLLELWGGGRHSGSGGAEAAQAADEEPPVRRADGVRHADAPCRRRVGAH